MLMHLLEPDISLIYVGTYACWALFLHMIGQYRKDKSHIENDREICVSRAICILMYVNHPKWYVGRTLKTLCLNLYLLGNFVAHDARMGKPP